MSFSNFNWYVNRIKRNERRQIDEIRRQELLAKKKQRQEEEMSR